MSKSTWLRRAGLAAAIFVAAVGFDLSRPPGQQMSARFVLESIHLYQKVGHRFVPRGQCRFSPTCSSYAEVVIREHGALEGGWLTAKRLIRCGPWTPEGTKDPPPVGSKSETP